LERSDCTSALFFILFSIFVCQQSIGIGLGTLRQPGPGLLSFGVGAGTGILSLGLLIKSFLFRTNPIEPGQGKAPIRKEKFILICVSLFVYAIAVDWLGFILSTFVFVLLLFHLIEANRWWNSLLKAVLITAGNYLIFVIWLKISVPKGFLGW